MPYHWKWIGLILACMVGAAHADPWDDFANNLFTDLAPLIALFGERATMQFMSQALGWEDCVILAMAPLGIITILVSAIRVGGPAWLRAIVGRARENMSAAEMELMSSTSKEVCELYNGETIVRCQGSTPVWEFLYLIPIGSRNQDPNKKLEIKVLTLEEACKKEKNLLRKDPPSEDSSSQDPPSQDSPPSSTGNMARIIRKVFATSLSPSTKNVSVEHGIQLETSPEQPPSEAIYVIRNMGNDAPNIILNLQNHNSNRTELQAYAAIGVILQMCVLSFFGIITYHPTLKKSFQKDEKSVDDYAFPLAISGTLVLALGVFLCGTVVEKSTQETHYKKNEKYEMRMVWIQQKQTVGDQVFEPFATFPGAPRDTVSVSRRRTRAEREELERWTVIGICIGLAGFIIQFVGLRGMNSAATLVQLGVIGIMTAIRAWVRRRLALPPQQEKLTSGFELDTLAWALTLLKHSPERPSPDQGPPPVNNSESGDRHQQAEKDPRDLAQAGNMTLENQKHLVWSLSTGGNVDHRPFLQTRSPSDSRAQRVFETRWNLTRLARFKGPSATEAINLVTAMEKIMSVLFPLKSGESEKAWAWPLTVIYNDSESAESQCHINISVTGKDRAWKVLADQLESVLSLCLFTARKEEQSRSKDGQAEFNLNNKDDDWLRQKTINSGLGIRLLGSADAEKTDQLIQDLRWWAPETFDAIAEIQDDNGTEGQAENPKNPETSFEVETRKELDQIIKSDPRLDDIGVDDNRVVGYGPVQLPCQGNGTRKRRFRNFFALNDTERKEKRRGTLAIESNDSLEKLFAKDLLFSFLFSAAKTLPTALQAKVETRETTTGSSLNDTSRVLVTKEMTSLVAEFGRLRYGTEQEAWLSIITPLSMTEKLPSPGLLLHLAKERAGKFRQNHKWVSATDIYLELWKQTQRLSLSAENIRGWVTAFILEHLRDLEDEKKRLEVEDEAKSQEVLMALEKIRAGLRVSKHQPDFFAHLQRLYKWQRRPLELEGLPVSSLQDGSTSQNIFPDYFGITKLHSKAMDPNEDIRACNEEVLSAVNERDICGWTPLHYAIISRNEAAIRALAKKGADPHLKNLKGYTSVHYLCPAGYDDHDPSWKVSWKLDARGLDGATPMHIAAGSGNLRAIELRRVLEYIVRGELPRPTELALNLRDFNERLPIHWAVIHGHEGVVQILESNVEEPDMYGWTPLHLAVLYHKSGSTMIKTVFKLSVNKERLDKEGRTPLMLACKKWKRQAACELVVAGAEVNSTTPSGETALLCAIRREDVELVKILINRGAKVDHSDNARPGHTPLHAAVEVKNDEIMRIILGSPELKTRPEDINFKDFRDQTPLHLAALFKRPETMALLLSAGADPNNKDFQGGTPLHSVFKQARRMMLRQQEHDWHLEMVTMLVKNGADPEAQDAYSKTPLDLAEEKGFKDTAGYLRGVLEARKPART